MMIGDPYKEIDWSKYAEPPPLKKYFIKEINLSNYAKKDVLITEKVDHPKHYTQGDIECIDAMKASMSLESFKGYLKGNVFKYLWRYENKNNTEDLNKAKWYLERLIIENGI